MTKKKSWIKNKYEKIVKSFLWNWNWRQKSKRTHRTKFTDGILHSLASKRSAHTYQTVDYENWSIYVVLFSIAICWKIIRKLTFENWNPSFFLLSRMKSNHLITEKRNKSTWNFRFENYIKIARASEIMWLKIWASCLEWMSLHGIR